MRLAADLASKPDEPQADADAAEIDVSHLVRPERFILPDVCGLAVPTMILMGDKPAGRWQLYLQWADGRRETAADAQRYRPAQGPEGVDPSRARRGPRRWQAGLVGSFAGGLSLKGQAAPDPADLFAANLPETHRPLHRPARATRPRASWRHLAPLVDPDLLSTRRGTPCPILNIGGPIRAAARPACLKFSGELALPLPCPNVRRRAAAATVSHPTCPKAVRCLSTSRAVEATPAPNVGTAFHVVAGYGEIRRRGLSGWRTHSGRCYLISAYGPKAVTVFAVAAPRSGKPVYRGDNAGHPRRRENPANR